jgi:hypothetical protein
MNLLQEITPPLWISLIASGEPPNYNAVLCDRLLIQRVLFTAFHARSILPTIGLVSASARFLTVAPDSFAWTRYYRKTLEPLVFRQFRSVHMD